MKIAARILITLILCVPLAIILTLILFPFWGWFESITAIESFGHSGPAEWCFVAVYVTLIFIGLLYKIVTRKNKKPNS